MIVTILLYIIKTKEIHKKVHMCVKVNTLIELSEKLRRELSFNHDILSKIKIEGSTSKVQINTY